jgi:penicillin-binding protein activator
MPPKCVKRDKDTDRRTQMKKRTVTLTTPLAATVALAACLMLAGCATQVYYGDPKAVEQVNIDFGSTDLQMIAEQMVQSLLGSAVFEGGKHPVFYVAQVKNRTDEHIDTKSVTDKIRVSLLRSGKPRFTATTEVGDELLNQMEYQTGSGLVRPDTAKKLGQQVGADYFLYGEITSIRKKGGRVEDVYFKFTLNLVNIENGLIEWADEKEIRKGEKRPVFGG